jgi:hypothetical protein
MGKGPDMGKGNSEYQGNASQRFMRATGKLREAESQQWETITRPDGSTYVVPRNPDDKSLR